MASDANATRREERVLTRRVALIGLGQAVVLGVLGTRLYDLQVREAARFAPLADDNRFSTWPLAPQRGRILDRFGVVLASNAEGYRVTAVPALADDLASTLERLSRILPLSAEDQARAVARAKRQPPTQPIVVAGNLTWEQVATVNLFRPELPGIEAEIFGRRQYFHGSAVGHVVGHVGAVERLGMGDDPVLRIPGMRVGRTGVERGMESRLRGVAGAERREVDARGRIVRNLSRTESQAGEDVVLTLDLDLQRQVVQRLARERRAAAVALDVGSGEVVAMASAPGYDPAEVMAARTGQAWRKLESRSNDPLFNRATTGLYPPGSTFKLVTVLAALEAGAIDLSERIDCQGGYVLGDRTYRCWSRSGHGRCDMHRAMRESCDIYFYEIARRTGMDRIAAMARRLGLGQTFDAGIAPQAIGVVPTPSWKRARLGRAWVGGETLIAGIGQGYVLATPLQLAVMTARVATGSVIMPTLVRPLQDRAPTAFPLLGVADRWLGAVRHSLRAVVHEAGGTGARASLGPGATEVAGKTGTSQINRRSTDRSSESLKWEERDHALFVGYFPASAPRYAVSAVVEHGGSGGLAAAPLVRDIMYELMIRDPMRRAPYSPATSAAASGAGHASPGAG